MKTSPLALVVREPVRRRRSPRVAAVAERVTARASTPAVDADARTALLVDALAGCLFDEIRARREGAANV